MRSEMIWLWTLASAIALWFVWGSLQWVRVGLRGASSCDGRVVEPDKAYLRAALKGAAALAVLGCVAVYGFGGSTAWAIAGPPVVLLLSYLAEREWYRSLGRPSA